MLSIHRYTSDAHTAGYWQGRGIDVDAVEKGVELMLFRAYIIGAQHFYGKGPPRLLRAGSRAARGKITVSGIFCTIGVYIIYMWPPAA
jgi:hypothetical protein